MNIDEILTKESTKGRTFVAGHKCGGYSSLTDYGTEYDCDYDSGEVPCDECVFVVGHETNDYRKGKRPWANKWHLERAERGSR